MSTTALRRPRLRPSGPERSARGACSVIRGRAAEPSWARPALIALLIVTAAAYLWDLSASGYADSFYAAAVQAGTKSWKALFFGSLDSRARRRQCAAYSSATAPTPSSAWGTSRLRLLKPKIRPEGGGGPTAGLGGLAPTPGGSAPAGIGSHRPAAAIRPWAANARAAPSLVRAGRPAPSPPGSKPTSSP